MPDRVGNMPFDFPDDPEDPTDCGDVRAIPRACDLGYVEGAGECTVMVGDRVTFMEEAWADEQGVTHAWLSTEEENLLHVSNWA